jgi:hypothetical protein
MNIHDTVRALGLDVVKAGGQGSGRHKELDAVEKHLKSKGFTLDKNNTSADGRTKTYHHPDQELASGIKDHVKSLGLVNEDVDRSGKPRKYGPSGNQHENFNKPGESSGGDFIQVGKHKDSRGGSQRGTSVSLNHGWKSVHEGL